MKTCEQCEYYNANETSEEFARKYNLDGYCEMLECGINSDEFPCKRFVEKEND